MKLTHLPRLLVLVHITAPLLSVLAPPLLPPGLVGGAELAQMPWPMFGCMVLVLLSWSDTVAALTGRLTQLQQLTTGKILRLPEY